MTKISAWQWANRQTAFSSKASVCLMSYTFTRQKCFIMISKHTIPLLCMPPFPLLYTTSTMWSGYYLNWWHLLTVYTWIKFPPYPCGDVSCYVLQRHLLISVMLLIVQSLHRSWYLWFIIVCRGIPDIIERVFLIGCWCCIQQFDKITSLWWSC